MGVFKPIFFINSLPNLFWVIYLKINVLRNILTYRRFSKKYPTLREVQKSNYKSYFFGGVFGTYGVIPANFLAIIFCISSRNAFSKSKFFTKAE